MRVKALHGDMSQGQRDGVMIAFKGGRERLLVATDVAARGLDISGVTPRRQLRHPELARTSTCTASAAPAAPARRGRAITLITPKQRRELEAIERHAKTEIARVVGRTATQPQRQAASRERETRRAAAHQAAPRATACPTPS